MPAGHVSARATVVVLVASTFAHKSPVMRLSSREETVLAEWKERSSRWWWRIDRWFVNLRGFSRSISPSPLPLLVFIVREMMWIPTRCPWIESAVIPGFHSQVVVSSLPPCSLSLLRWGAETGAMPARSPVIIKMGLSVPIAAQAAPLQFSSCRWS